MHIAFRQLERENPDLVLGYLLRAPAQQDKDEYYLAFKQLERENDLLVHGYLLRAAAQHDEDEAEIAAQLQVAE
jgi:hypothetical protein